MGGQPAAGRARQCGWRRGAFLGEGGPESGWRFSQLVRRSDAGRSRRFLQHHPRLRGLRPRSHLGRNHFRSVHAPEVRRNDCKRVAQAEPGRGQRLDPKQLPARRRESAPARSEPGAVDRAAAEEESEPRMESPGFSNPLYPRRNGCAATAGLSNRWSNRTLVRAPRVRSCCLVRLSLHLASSPAMQHCFRSEPHV